MRILFCHKVGGAWGFITDGMINAFRDKGHQVERWNGQESSWHDFNPDLYIGCSGHKQPIPNKRQCKVAIHVNPSGPININGIMENNDNIKWVINNKPDVVFGYGYDCDKIYWNNWEGLYGIKWIPMPTAGDKTLYRDLSQPRNYDIIYLGGRWAYKSKTIDKYLLPVLSKIPNYKLYGWGGWPDNITSGVLKDEDVCEFLNSGLIAPCISEEHTQNYGIDIPERAFKAALCGALIIHDYIPRFNNIIPSALVAKNPQEFLNLCLHYVNNTAAEIAKSQRDHVLSNHTYHHRISRLLFDLGFAEESKNMIGEE